MFLIAVLLVVGFVLLGREAARPEPRPWFILAGGALAAAGWLVAFSQDGIGMAAMARGFAWSGVGLLAAAGLIATRRGAAKPWLALGVVALLLGAILFGTRSFFPNGESSTAELLVELGPDDSIEELSELLDAFSASAERAFPMIDLEESEDLAQVYLVRVPARRAADLSSALRADAENVDHLEANLTLRIDPPEATESSMEIADDILENDPLAPRQWALGAIRGHEAHRMLAGLAPVRVAEVAIVDTGVDGSHEDIEGVFEGSPTTRDANGHGSHCAGIAGASTNNGLGIASLNWEGRFVRVSSYSALDAQGMGSVESTSDAILEAAEAGADVISLSLGASAPTIPKTMRDAVSYARDRGAIVIAAAGNDNEDAALHVPSNIDGVVAVSAVDQRLAKARFSNTNSGLSRPIAAPGVDILSLQTTGGYTSKSGTSMATPLVAGLAGIMVSLRPDLSADEFYRIVLETGKTVDDSPLVGRVIQADAALNLLLSGGL